VAKLADAHGLGPCPVRGGGSSPLLGTSGYGLVAECDLPKVETRVRFSLPASGITYFIEALAVALAEINFEMEKRDLEKARVLMNVIFKLASLPV
jgi:hypothetical protein